MADESAVIDQPTEDLVFDDQLDDQHTDDSGGEQKEPQQSAEDKVDGRKFNQEWSRTLKEMKELYAADPVKGPLVSDMITKLRDNYARYQDVQQLAPKGLDDVRQWKATLDALGGSEAAAEMMQRVAEVEQIDAKIEAGDFSVISELPESMQKGFYGMIPDALSTMAEKDPQGFSAAVAPHFQAALAATGLGDVLREMYSQAGDNDALKATIKKTFDWYQGQTQGAGAMPAGQKTVSPEVQRLRDELDQRRKGDDDSFVKGITDNTLSYVSESFTKTAEVYIKQFNLTDAQKDDLMDSYRAKLTEKLGADAAFNKQLAAYKALKNRNPETVNTYIKGKIDEMAKPIIDGLVSARYGGIRKKAAAPAAATTTTSGGATRVAQAPDQSQWDMDKMLALGHDATVRKGIFHLTGGRTVQLARPN